MAFLINYIVSLLKAARIDKFLKWIAPSLQEDSGKPSGKRLAGFNSMTLVSYIVISHVSFGTDADVELIITLLSFAAVCFGLTYIPTRKSDTNPNQPPTP